MDYSWQKIHSALEIKGFRSTFRFQIQAVDVTPSSSLNGSYLPVMWDLLSFYWKVLPQDKLKPDFTQSGFDGLCKIIRL